MILSKKNPIKSGLICKKSNIISYNKELTRQSSVSSASESNKQLEYRNIVDLPDDVLHIILENYLDLKSIFNLKSTCKRFYIVCSDNHLFRKLDLQPFWSLITEDFIEDLSCLTENIEMLNLSWTKLSSPEKIEL